MSGTLTTRGWSLAAKLAYSAETAEDLPGWKGVPCLIWLLPLDQYGYGEMWWLGENVAAHRLAWLEAFGPVPDGWCICHHCDVRCCIEPLHLFIGSNLDNIAGRSSSTRASRPRSPATTTSASPLIGKIKRRMLWSHLHEEN
jgi:hypothetical protein